ncbi:ADP-ribose pyrophosphatase, mitochondrial isoform X2 [Tachypleus tridentatus]|uniref:ADP-ribose pyrophosphatase, mitochondrial isoform X2 n=1 Tax=Tachypleus tridentatus TaxID=6853 RepID=UPI003FD4C28E
MALQSSLFGCGVSWLLRATVILSTGSAKVSGYKKAVTATSGYLNLQPSWKYLHTCPKASSKKVLEKRSCGQWYSVVITGSLKTVSRMVHCKCRNGVYPRTAGQQVERLPVPAEKVPWSVEWDDYHPPWYSMKGLTSMSWADPNIGWKKNDKGDIIKNPSSGLPLLQFVSIQRKDSGEWAIPGGMVDPGELVSVTLKREFFEEALNSLSMSDEEKAQQESELDNFFSNGKEIYRGYVDDPRNTDNAWMETVVYNFHDETGDIVGKFPLQAGDDAAKVRWTDISQDLQLYASHSNFLCSVAEYHEAHW